MAEANGRPLGEGKNPGLRTRRSGRKTGGYPNCPFPSLALSSSSSQEPGGFVK